MFIASYLITGVVINAMCLFENPICDWSDLKDYFKEEKAWNDTIKGIILWPVKVAELVRTKTAD